MYRTKIKMTIKNQKHYAYKANVGATKVMMISQGLLEKFRSSSRIDSFMSDSFDIDGFIFMMEFTPRWKTGENESMPIKFAIIISTIKISLSFMYTFKIKKMIQFVHGCVNTIIYHHRRWIRIVYP